MLEVNVKKKRAAAMQTVINTPEISANTVVTNLVETSLCLEERAVMGNKSSFAHAVWRKKVSLLQSPKKPHDLAHLLDSHSKTADGERFLIANFMSNNKRNLLFTSRQGLNMIKWASAISRDGTFDLAQDLFYELFLIMACLNGKSHLAAYALLGDKTATTYRLMWQHLREAMLKPLPSDTAWSPAPGSYYTDYECAAHNEFKNTFPEVKAIQGALQALPMAKAASPQVDNPVL